MNTKQLITLWYGTAAFWIFLVMLIRASASVPTDTELPLVGASGVLLLSILLFYTFRPLPQVNKRALFLAVSIPVLLVTVAFEVLLHVQGQGVGSLAVKWKGRQSTALRSVPLAELEKLGVTAKVLDESDLRIAIENKTPYRLDGLKVMISFVDESGVTQFARNVAATKNADFDGLPGALAAFNVQIPRRGSYQSSLRWRITGATGQLVGQHDETSALAASLPSGEMISKHEYQKRNGRTPTAEDYLSGRVYRGHDDRSVDAGLEYLRSRGYRANVPNEPVDPD